MELRTLRKQIMGALALLALSWSSGANAWLEGYTPSVIVTDPFIDMHTGPGRGYPVFYVAGQGDEVVILKRRTDWFKVRVPRGKEGWVHIDQLRSTLDLAGNPVSFGEVGLSHYEKRRWEVGMTGGDLEGAATLAGYVGFALTPNIGLQLEGAQVLGDFSDGYMYTGSILMFPFPTWRVSPYFTIGTGIIKTSPQTTIVRADDRKDEIVHAGAGANLYLSDRFILRMEYRRHTVLTSRDDNQEIDQWKAGFSVFF